LLITAARYEPQGGRLLMAQGYQPFGQVWSDIQLYRRDELVERLQSGQRLATGRATGLATDFEPLDQLRLVKADGGPWLRANGGQAPGDDLGVARF